MNKKKRFSLGIVLLAVFLLGIGLLVATAQSTCAPWLHAFQGTCLTDTGEIVLLDDLPEEGHYARMQIFQPEFPDVWLLEIAVQPPQPGTYTLVVESFYLDERVLSPESEYYTAGCLEDGVPLHEGCFMDGFYLKTRLDADPDGLENPRATYLVPAQFLEVQMAACESGRVGTVLREIEGVDVCLYHRIPRDQSWYWNSIGE